ncbi:MAG: DoxX family protein [bacterium]
MSISHRTSEVSSHTGGGTEPTHSRATTSRQGAGVDTQTAAYAVFALRIALGVVFIAHGLLKYFTFTLPGTAAFFVAHGFPGWTAYPVFAAELIGGAALVTGVYARWVALALVPVLFGAITVSWPNGWSFTAPNGGWEYVAFLIAADLALVGLGDGAWALRRSWSYENLSRRTTS